MHKGLPRRSWACPVAQRGVLNGEGASATTAPKCTKVHLRLQLGQDLFNHSPAFAPLAARILSTSYTLLNREPLARIAAKHGKHRASQALDG